MDCACKKRDAEIPNCGGGLNKCPCPNEHDCGECEMFGHRRGDWIETYTGQQFWPLSPEPSEVNIKDIAHALSQICRFNGMTKYFFSVGQHSLNCMELARILGWSEKIQLLALMHDAAEAYIKESIAGYKEIEWAIYAAIRKGLGIPKDSLFERVKVKELDNIMLVTEAAKLMPFKGWGGEYEPTNLVRVKMQPMREVEADFLLNYDRLKEMIACPSTTN
jgi:5'-deoxynucleotidase YfbR-like HD superfamily hydrolase